MISSGQFQGASSESNMAIRMGERRLRHADFLLQKCTAISLFVILIGSGFLDLTAAQLRNCSFSAVYSFGDSLTDNGNAIAGLPDQFIDSESNPNGVNFPHHAADRYCDGRLLVDYIGIWLQPLISASYLTARMFLQIWFSKILGLLTLITHLHFTLKASAFSCHRLSEIPDFGLQIFQYLARCTCATSSR